MQVSKPFAAPSGKQEPHVHVIAKPKRKCDVPAVPKIADVSSEEWSVEIFRSVDPKEITKTNGKSAIPGEIEEQIKTVSVHVTDQRPEAPTARHRLEPVMFDQCRDYEFIKES